MFLKRNTTKKKKVFFLYTTVVFILILVGFSLRYLLNERESYFKVVRLYVSFEYCLLAYYYSLHVKNKLINKFLLGSTLAFIAFVVYDYIIQRKPGLPFGPFSVEYIIFLILIIYYFYEVIQDMVTEPIYQKAIFWVSVAFIINFSGNFFLFLYSMNSYNDESFKRQYAIIYATVTVIKNLLLCISIAIKESSEISTPNHSFDVDLDLPHPIKN